MTRDIKSIPTKVNGLEFRSRTEARWAIFFDAIGIQYVYEKERIGLSNGESYLPDFYLPEFDAFFEVKADNDAIVTEECTRARCLAADRRGQRVWLAVGPPNADRPNILPLDKWEDAVAIEEILSTSENRYHFLEDRRDEGVYWLQANSISGMFRHSYCVGGFGKITDHDRLPLFMPRITTAYEAAAAARWE